MSRARFAPASSRTPGAAASPCLTAAPSSRAFSARRRSRSIITYGVPALRSAATIVRPTRPAPTTITWSACAVGRCSTCRPNKGSKRRPSPPPGVGAVSKGAMSFAAANANGLTVIESNAPARIRSRPSIGISPRDTPKSASIKENSPIWASAADTTKAVDIG